MSEFKGTPGPWIADGRHVLHSGGHASIATAWYPRQMPDTNASRLHGESWLEARSRPAPVRDSIKGEAEANARLIAAAPELLEALKRLTSFAVTDVVESCNGNKCRELWCAGCFGEEEAENTVREAREALVASRAAIAKATGDAE